MPQVPRHQATLQARREGRLQLGLQARWTGDAYEDDRNTLTLEDALQVDLFAGYELGRGVTLFASAENLFDAEIVAARTPVPSLAPPRLVRAGVRCPRLLTPPTVARAPRRGTTSARTTGRSLEARFSDTLPGVPVISEV